MDPSPVAEGRRPFPGFDRLVAPAAFRRITLAALIALGFVIVTGGAVRLTGSGLGCPQWPACKGGHLVAPVSFYPQVEFLNRVTTLVVSVAMIGAAAAALARRPRRRDLTWLSMGLALGLVAEIVLGGATVRHRLDPAFVMAHFLLSMVLVADAVVLHHRAGMSDDAVTARGRRPAGDGELRSTSGQLGSDSGRQIGSDSGREMIWVGRLMIAAAAVTVVAGTVVTGAGPHSGANAGDGRVRRWHIGVHRATQVHGISAMVLLALVGGAWLLLRSRGGAAGARRRLERVVEALAAQVAVGYTQYLTGVPALLVAGHILGAVVVWTCIWRFALCLSSGVVTPPAPTVARARGATRGRDGAMFPDERVGTP